MSNPTEVRAKLMELADWWGELSPEGQAEYIKEHPRSKKAREAKAKVKKTDTKAKQSKPNHKTPLKDEHVPDAHKDVVKKTIEKVKQAEPAKRSLAKRISDMLHKRVFSAVDHKFFDGDGIKPGSPQRKKVAESVKGKSSAIVEHLKGQKEEWTHGIKAIKKYALKQELSHHESEAMKAVIKDLIITVGSVAVVGGFGHGLALALGHFGFDLVKDACLKAFAHGAVHTQHASAKPSSDEDAMKAVIEQLSEFIGNGDIPDESWEHAVKELERRGSRKDVHSKPKEKASFTVEAGEAPLQDAQKEVLEHVKSFGITRKARAFPNSHTTFETNNQPAYTKMVMWLVREFHSLGPGGWWSYKVDPRAIIGVHVLRPAPAFLCQVSVSWDEHVLERHDRLRALLKQNLSKSLPKNLEPNDESVDLSEPKEKT